MRVGEGLKILLSQKKKKKDGKQILCFRTKTAHIEQLLFDPIGPFSQVLSQLSRFMRAKPEGEGGYRSIIQMLPWYNYFIPLEIKKK